MLDTECFTIRNEGVIRAALARRVKTPVDFVDAYLSETARQEGLYLATFDRDFDRLDAARMQVS